MSGNVGKASSQKVTPPPPVNVPRYAPEEVAKALRLNHGNKSAAARSLGCERRTVQRYCEEHPEVRAAGEEGIEVRIDRIEEKWEEAYEAGEAWAIQLGLRGQGAKRGHAEKSETTIQLDVSKLTDEQLAELAAGKSPLAVLAGTPRES